MKIIFLGAPGAGKGTQAELVSDRLGIPTISTGAIIREAIKNGTETGLKAKKLIEQGNLLPDEIVIEIVKDRLAKSDCSHGYILDGFPRTVPQAEALDHMGVELDKVVSLEVDDDVILERMTGRRVCSTCGKTYHIHHAPSKDGENCDKCKTKLSIRADDAPEVVKSRLDLYHDITEPLKHYYADSGKLVLIPGEKEIATTTRHTLEALEIE